MARTVAEIQAEIRELAPDDKERLLEALIDEVEGPADLDGDRAWLEEVQKRSRELDEGTVSAVSWEDALANVRSGLRKIRKS